MKNILLPLFCLLSSRMILPAQSIPNSGFENWTFVGGWFYNPDPWTTNNNQIVESVKQDTNAYQGNYAMQVLANGYAGIVFPLTIAAGQISVQVKTNIMNGDTASIRVWVYSGGAVTDSGSLNLSTTVSAWSYYSIPITYNALAPDSMKIRVKGGTMNGSWISLDAFTHDLTGVEEYDSPLSIYPNPADDEIRINGTNLPPGLYRLTLYSAEGRVVRRERMQAPGILSLHRQGLTGGIYYLQLADENAGIYPAKMIFR